MKHDRTLGAILISGFVIGIFSLWQIPSDNRMFSEDGFYANKILQGPEYDAVICGDSRPLIGISPNALSETLGGVRIFNYSFPAIGLSQTYLNACADLIDPSSELKMIIIGVTAEIFIREEHSEDIYSRYSELNKRKLKEMRSMGSITGHFKPFAFLFRRGGKKRERIIYTDGWMAEVSPVVLLSPLLNNARMRLESKKVSKKIRTRFMKSIQVLTKNGFQVIGFRPPSHPEMDKIENKLGGFSESEVSRQFEKTGGKWISVQRDIYESYDASHLNKTNAIRFSKDLGKLISSSLQRKD